MIRQVLALTVKELKVLWRDREALVLLFAMPLFFILVMSWALQGVYEAGTRDRPVEILVVSEGAGREAAEVLADLARLEGLKWVASVKGAPVTLERAEALLRNGRFDLALRLRRGVGRPAAPAELIVDPTLNRRLLHSIQGAIQGVLQRRVLMEKLVPLLEGLPGEALKPAPRLLETRMLSGFKTGRRPTATEQHVPAYTIFGVFFIVLTLASGLLREKQEGTFRRILTAPLSRTALLAGKLVPYYLVNLVQIGLMFAVGWAVFQVRLGSIPALTVVSLTLAASILPLWEMNFSTRVFRRIRAPFFCASAALSKESLNGSTTASWTAKTALTSGARQGSICSARATSTGWQKIPYLRHNSGNRAI